MITTPHPIYQFVIQSAILAAPVLQVASCLDSTRRGNHRASGTRGAGRFCRRVMRWTEWYVGNDLLSFFSLGFPACALREQLRATARRECCCGPAQQIGKKIKPTQLRHRRKPAAILNEVKTQERSRDSHPTKEKEVDRYNKGERKKRSVLNTHQLRGRSLWSAEGRVGRDRRWRNGAAH